jgi:hypothetical protein
LQTGANASHGHESNAMLAALSFGELVSLCETKCDELQRGRWQGEAGHECLDFAISLAGLSWPKLPAAHTEHIAEAYLSPEKISTVSLFRRPCQLAGLRECYRVRISYHHCRQLLRIIHNTWCRFWLPSYRRHLLPEIFDWPKAVTAVKLAIP